MKLPKNAVYTAAERLGAHVEWDQTGSVFSIRVAAPRGQHWTDGQVHELLTTGRATTPLQKDEMWIDALGRMNAGLDVCDLNDQACEDWAE